jgi:hypothetical protein
MVSRAVTSLFSLLSSERSAGPTGDGGETVEKAIAVA